MNERYVIQLLRDHESDLKAAGVVHLRLFGSVARGDASLQSDVDLLVEFDIGACPTLVSMGRLQSRLSEILGASVDLAPYGSLKGPVEDRASREAILAF